MRLFAFYSEKKAKCLLLADQLPQIEERSAGGGAGAKRWAQVIDRLFPQEKDTGFRKAARGGRAQHPAKGNRVPTRRRKKLIHRLILIVAKPAKRMSAGQGRC